MTEAQTTDRPTVAGNAPIQVGRRRLGCTWLDVVAVHGPDWFPLSIGTGDRLGLTLYLRRAELIQLRDRLDEIDKAMPPVEVES